MKAAVLGYGTVGSGVVEVLQRNREAIRRKTGEDFEVKAILDLRDFPGDPNEGLVTHDFQTILQDEEIGVVAETMGGLEPAHTFTEQLLIAGKSVCTSNKELVAQHGTALLRTAREHGVNYLFEASCGGGIPIIRPLHTCLTGDEILEVAGILNGTTNYMLTCMAREGSEYDDVLKEAQNMGYAERNPAADVEGYDPQRKIAILGSIAFGKRIEYQEIPTEGITQITAADFRYAEELGALIKLVAIARRENGKVYAQVAPVLVGPSDPLYSVNDVYNAVFVHGNMLGDAMFYGRGAGKLPTASAVVGDLVDAALHPGTDVMASWEEEKQELADSRELEFRYLVRAEGEPDSQRLRESFGPVQLVQPKGMDGEYGFLTEHLTGWRYEEAAASLGTVLHGIKVRTVTIRS